MPPGWCDAVWSQVGWYGPGARPTRPSGQCCRSYSGATLAEQALLAPDPDADDSHEAEVSAQGENRYGDDDVGGGHRGPPNVLTCGCPLPQAPIWVVCPIRLIPARPVLGISGCVLMHPIR